MKNVFIAIVIAWTFSPSTVSAQWMQKSSFPGDARGYTLSTSLGDKIYVGGGYLDDGNNSNEFWEYNTTTDKWTQKKHLPGTTTNRSYGIAFTINGKVYLGLGVENWFSNSSRKNLKDLWEYDPIADNWTQKKDYPGDGSFSCSFFVVDNKAYIVGGTGTVGSNDTWEYNPVADKWTQKSDIPYTYLNIAMGFNHKNKGYILGGFWSNPGIYKKLWEYDPNTDKWAEKASYPDSGLCGGVAFIVDDKLYAGLGNNVSILQPFNSSTKNFKVYDFVTDSWSNTSNIFPGIERGFCFAHVIKGKAYIGLGWKQGNNDDQVFKDVYEYTPVSTFVSRNTLFSNQNNVIISPNPSTGRVVIKVPESSKDPYCFNIYDTRGAVVFTSKLNNTTLINLSHLPSGNYIIHMSKGNREYTDRLILSTSGK